MTATLEQIGELRSDVRHIQSAVDRMLAKQDELLDRFGDHLTEDARAFAAVDQKIEISAAEKRGFGKAAHVAHLITMTVIAAVAGAFGAHLPSMH